MKTTKPKKEKWAVDGSMLRTSESPYGYYIPVSKTGEQDVWVFAASDSPQDVHACYVRAQGIAAYLNGEVHSCGCCE